MLAETRPDGQWLQTFTGRKFWPLDPRPEDVCIEDVAHALAHQCRYAGHCARFYSVAEHSVLVMRFASPENRLAALLHDAAEAYLCDIPRPLKKQLPGYVEAEHRAEIAIAQAFGISHQWPWPDEVKEIDNRILADERRLLMARTDVDNATWGAHWPELGLRELSCWPAGYAETVFLSEFRKITGAA